MARTITITEMKAETERVIRDWLNQFLRLIGEPLEFELQGRQNSVLINLRGVKSISPQDYETLKAIAYLLEVVVRRRTGEGLRVQLDIDGYREKRRAELRELALRLAAEALRERKRIRLNPMESWERKAIHEALADYQGVRTYSEGQGKERRVIIEPEVELARE